MGSWSETGTFVVSGGGGADDGDQFEMPFQEYFRDLSPLPLPPAEVETPDDFVLPFIAQMLMEEDVDDKYFFEYPDHPVLLAAEKSFLDILTSDSSDSPGKTASSGSGGSSSSGAEGSLTAAEEADPAAFPLWPHDRFEVHSSGDDGVLTSAEPYATATAALPSWPYEPFEVHRLQTSPFYFSAADEGLVFSPPPPPPEFDDAAMLNSAFLSGVEEAKKFLPSDGKLVIDLEAAVSFDDGGFSPLLQPVMPVLKREDEEESDNPFGRGRKNPFGDSVELEEGPSRKMPAVAASENETDAIRQMFDKFGIRGPEERCEERFIELRHELIGDAASGKEDRSVSGRNRGRRRQAEVVDLRTLLIHCAQAVATDDRRSATELLKQIRQHATPTGDAMQRLAYCFADGLQARLAGAGSQIYEALCSQRTSISDMLKAYMLYMLTIPFKKASFIFSNNSIIAAIGSADRVHIIDFGIQLAFQWPCFLSSLSKREGGPPHLRITGIDHPLPGFRPAERIEESGHRLAGYAAEFGVPFEYRPIACSHWETLQPEDLIVDPSEVLVVNTLFQFKSLTDDIVVSDSPRDILLATVRKLRPRVFVHGVVNGAYSAPFFVTRFREVLFHYTAMFDMLDATIPRENEQRMLLEREMFRRSALNVISCEGAERVERPETYKQWQVRNVRAGLRQKPLLAEVVAKVRDKVRRCYHKDFLIDVDNGWLVQGWKGRILYALSTWVAADAVAP